MRLGISIAWRVAGILVLAASPFSVASAQTAPFPARSVKIVVPAPPGPLLDALPRILADKLAAKWGQPVIIENRPGAAQNLGAEAVAKAEPDGYTLLVTPPGPLTVSEFYFEKLGFDPRAFAPIAVLVALPTVIVANPKVPAASLGDLVRYATANPGKLNFGSPGVGSTPHLAMERLMRQAGIQLVHVPYQGFGPAMNDLLGGHIQVMIDNLGNTVDHVRSGKLTLLAVNSQARNTEFPNVPASTEVVNDFVHADWFALVAPPRTPASICDAISRAISESMALPDVAKRLQAFAVIPVGNSPSEAAKFIEVERDRWRSVIAASGGMKQKPLQ